MAYVEGQTIHDADSHIMELPGALHSFIDPNYRSAFIEKTGDESRLFEVMANAAAQHDDPEFRAGAEANILLRKNHAALGSFRSQDRVAAL
ncbi:MAG: hypothetical protein RLZZ141_2277, partial [Pseudomonadota bacterium]